jgi:hypothetical protein
MTERSTGESRFLCHTRRSMTFQACACGRVLRFTAFALALASGCGGLATDGEREEAPAEPVEEIEEVEVLPDSFEVLELRKQFEDPVPGDPPSCDYAARWKVNMETGHLIAETCEHDAQGYLTVNSTRLLDPLELASVRVAYGRLRSGSKGSCVSSRAVMTLALEVERDELLFADEAHSACPARGAEGRPAVSGLDALSSLLTALAAER